VTRVPTLDHPAVPLRCSLCNRPSRHEDDLYKLRLPEAWTAEDLRAWRVYGATVRELVCDGVTIVTVCARCRAELEETVGLDEERP
jgi:hypothetical protein